MSLIIKPYPLFLQTLESLYNTEQMHIFIFYPCFQDATAFLAASTTHLVNGSESWNKPLLVINRCAGMG